MIYYIISIDVEFFEEFFVGFIQNFTVLRIFLTFFIDENTFIINARRHVYCNDIIVAKWCRDCSVNS